MESLMLILTIAIEIDGEQSAADRITARQIARNVIQDVGRFDDVLSVVTATEEKN
jgi:hypothetical protein